MPKICSRVKFLDLKNFLHKKLLVSNRWFGKKKHLKAVKKWWQLFRRVRPSSMTYRSKWKKPPICSVMSSWLVIESGRVLPPSTALILSYITISLAVFYPLVDGCQLFVTGIFSLKLFKLSNNLFQPTSVSCPFSDACQILSLQLCNCREMKMLMFGLYEFETVDRLP